MDNLAVSLRAAAGNVSTGGGATNPNAWDISYAELDHTNSSNFFDIDEMLLASSTGVGTQEANPRGLFFKPDGTKMYITGNSGDDVNEYDLSTAWDPATATFNQVFSVSSQEATPSGVHFKPDGTKMYIIGYTGDDINEYDLSTAWDVSTASYQQNFSVASQEATPEDLWFKPDGTKMYITGTTSDIVREYDLSTAWDISTASYSQGFNLISPTNYEGGSRGLWFNSDGTGMWVSGTSGDGVDEFSLSTAWDVTTASHVQYLNLYSTSIFTSAGATGTAETNPMAIFFKPEGDKFFMVGNGQDKVHTYKVGVKYLDVSSEELTPNSISFKSNGTKMYILGSSGDDINEYDLSTAWDVSTATYSQTGSVKSDNSVMTAPQGMFFKDDGTKVYVTGQSSDVVGEYDLSTAWDISTMSHNQNFSVASQEATPAGVCFKDDGTKMYVTGYTSDNVLEYDLSTAWDVSTASYSQAFSVNSQEAAPRGVVFKTDGTKMYIAGSNGDEINEYDLSTAWDVSTATFNQNFKESIVQETVLTDVFFKPDGTRFWITGRTNDNVYQYNIRSS
jgi:6-phosphogluconolactonase (cycloisomerase 2 family)